MCIQVCLVWYIHFVFLTAFIVPQMAHHLQMCWKVHTDNPAGVTLHLDIEWDMKFLCQDSLITFVCPLIEWLGYIYFVMFVCLFVFRSLLLSMHDCKFYYVESTQTLANKFCQTFADMLCPVSVCLSLVVTLVYMSNVSRKKAEFIRRKLCPNYW